MYQNTDQGCGTRGRKKDGNSVGLPNPAERTSARGGKKKGGGAPKVNKAGREPVSGTKRGGRNTFTS